MLLDETRDGDLCGLILPQSCLYKGNAAGGLLGSIEGVFERQRPMSSGTTYPDTDEEELSPLSSPAGSGDNTNAFRSSQAVTAADTQMSNTAAAALLQPAG